MLIHGEKDRHVPVEQACRLAAQRQALALPTQLVVVPDATHGFFHKHAHHAEAGITAMLAHMR